MQLMCKLMNMESFVFKSSEEYKPIYTLWDRKQNESAFFHCKDSENTIGDFINILYRIEITLTLVVKLVCTFLLDLFIGLIFSYLDCNFEFPSRDSL